MFAENERSQRPTCLLLCCQASQHKLYSRPSLSKYRATLSLSLPRSATHSSSKAPLTVIYVPEVL